MRPLEIVLAAADLVVFVLVVRRPGRAWWVRIGVVAALLAAVAQPLVEGPRWQLVPAYALAAMLALAAVWPPRSARRRVGRLGVVLGAVVLAVVVALPIVLPVFVLPAPTGPYGVGTVTYDWSDTGRPELFTADPVDHRELMVQVWYPADTDPHAPREPYVPDAAVLAPLARLLGLPGFALDHLGYVTTNAVRAAPMAAARPSYPVLVFSPGRGGYRQHNTMEIEELVSRGYVVAAIDHTYAAAGVRFADGRVVELDPRMLDNRFVDSMVPYLAADVGFVLDRLTAVNGSDPLGVLTGRIDLRRAGAFGLSLGGEVVAEACRTDPRLLACLPMDVWMPADVLRDGLHRPTMWITRDAATMRSEGWTDADVDRTLGTITAAFDGLSGDGYLVQVPGMFHQDFSDAPFLSPLTGLLGITGPIGAERAHLVVSSYTAAFFDRHLRGLPAPLLDGPSDAFPDAVLHRRG